MRLFYFDFIITKQFPFWECKSYYNSRRMLVLLPAARAPLFQSFEIRNIYRTCGMHKLAIYYRLQCNYNAVSFEFRRSPNIQKVINKLYIYMCCVVVIQKPIMEAKSMHLFIQIHSYGTFFSVSSVHRVWSSCTLRSLFRIYTFLLLLVFLRSICQKRQFPAFISRS